MSSVFSTDWVKSSFPFGERVFDVIRTTPSDCLSYPSTFRKHHKKKRPDGKEQILAEYFTKGRILTIQGNVKIDQWEGKDGTPHAQLRVHAKYIDFLNIGKKQEGANAAANAATDNNVPDAPTDTPKEKKDDLPF